MNRTGRLALAGVAGVLAALLVVEYHASRMEDAQLPASTRATPPMRPGSQPQPVTDITQAQVDAILARPVFAATRRPPPGAAAAGPPAASALPRLTGVVVSSRGRTVIFAGPVDGKPIAVAEGGRIGAYLVQSIGAGEATVVGPDGSHVLHPVFDAKNNLGTAPAAPAAQPSLLDQLLRGSGAATGPAPGPGVPR